MVGRPREFDVDVALDAAMATFWSKGYESTSLTDLMSATGLHKGSLYKAFGDKHSLFLQALKRYLGNMRRTKHEILKSAPTPLDGLRAVIHRMIDFVDDGPCPMGCMAVNALVELAPHDEEVREIMTEHITDQRASLTELIGNAQAAGQISTKRPPELITALLLTMMAGLATTVKGPITKADAHALADAQIEALI